MSKLTRQKCIACCADAPLITQEEIDKLYPLIPEWSIDEVEGIKRLTREYSLKNFSEAIAYGNKVGGIAEQEGHHPAILIEWGKVTVSWWTHKIGGLHVNDFVMAAKTDVEFSLHNF